MTADEKAEVIAEHKATQRIRGWVVATMIAVLLAAALYISDERNANDLYDNQLASCQRVDLLRSQTREIRDAARVFALAAAEARQQSGDKEVAATYRGIAESLPAMPAVVCTRVVKRP